MNAAPTASRLLLPVLVLAGCNREAAAPAPAPAAPVVQPALTEIELPILTLQSPFAKDAEFRGLVTMAVLLGMGDIPGVVPVIASQAQPLSTAVARPIAKGKVHGRFTGGGTPEAVKLSLELCKEGGLCTTVEANGTRDQPWEAVGTLLEGVAHALAIPMPAETVALWHQPGSKDPYAELVAGRACAVWLGLLPPSEHPGDKRTDPIARALFLDPRQPLAAWVYGLWEIGTVSGGGNAAEALQRAVLARPSSPMLGADLALVRQLQGRPNEAVLAWEDVLARSPDDLRYLKPYADALVAAGRAMDARALLAKLPKDYDDDPQVAALRVQVAMAAKTTEDLDPLLAHWQEVDPKNATPVKLRVEQRVKARDFEGALPLLDVLRKRAPGPATDALQMALLVAVGRPKDAAALAPPELAARLRARAEREADPGADLSDLPSNDVALLLAKADAALWKNEPARALELADKALGMEPTLADAEVVRAQALELLDRGPLAVAAWNRAWTIDPAAEGGPVEAQRIGPTFKFVEVGKPTSVGPPARARPKGPEL